MDKLTAFSNAMAVFHYAHWRYPEEIIALTSNGATFEVDIQLEHDTFDSKAELNCLRYVIAAGAKIKLYEPSGASYDVISVTYRYEK